MFDINQLATLIKRERQPNRRPRRLCECASVALILIVIVVLITRVSANKNKDVVEHELDERTIKLFKEFTAEYDKQQPPSKSRRSLKNSQESSPSTSSSSSSLPPIFPPNGPTSAPFKRSNGTTMASQHLQQPGCVSMVANENAMNQNDQDRRRSFGYTEPEISRFVRPNFYTLRLKVDPNKRKFSGQLMIALDINQQQQQHQTSPAAISRNKRRTTMIQQTDTTKGDDEPGGHPNGPPASNSSDSHRYISLHSGANLNIRKAFYVLHSNVQIPATKIGRNMSSDLLTLDFHPNVVGAGQGLLLLVYTGQVNESDSHGFFVHRSQRPLKRTNQTTPLNGQRQPNQNQNQTNVSLNDDVGLATHMQPSFARRLFPAWDEPHFKARFGLIVVLPFRGYEVISNTPIKRKSISLSCSGESLQEIEFQTTPTMSTYLLALIVGRFDHIESITQNNCKVSAYFYSSTGQQQNGSNSSGEHVNHRLQAAQMALDVAVKTFDRLESLLGVKYPLAKFDMVALRDFQSGAMENWGASLFHENYLLCCYNSSSHNDIRLAGGSVRTKRLVVPLVVAHEIAHQWFGNLITLRSWSYLWLNEGFAQLLMYDVASYLFPEENYWHIFLEDSRQAAMREDELITSSRALEPPERDGEADAGLLEDEIMNLFDELTYNKGAAMVQMVSLAIGREQLFAGLGHYLLKHSYDSVNSHDLWAALEESTGQPDRRLESLMFNWLKLDGFPLVSVQVVESSLHYTLRLRQERFTLLPMEAMQQANHSSVDWSAWLWSIPISFSSELQPRPIALDLSIWPGNGGSGPAGLLSTQLLVEREASLVLAKSSVGRWFKLNFNATGYYRVDYATEGNDIEAGEAEESRHLREEGTSQSRKKKRGRRRRRRRRRRQVADSNNHRVDMLIRMGDSIRNRSMSVLDRFNVLDDLFSMVMVGKKQVSYYLRYLDEVFANENELIVLRLLFDSLDRIKSTLVMNSPISDQLEAQFDFYVQRFLRKLASNNSLGPLPASTSPPPLVGRTSGSSWTVAAESSSWFYSLRMQQLQAQQQRRKKTQTSLELAELLDSMRANFNELELLQRSSELFARHFRPTPPPPPGPQHPQQQSSWSPFELMGRDLRSSVYSAALNFNHHSKRATTLGSRGDLFDEPSRLQSSGPVSLHNWHSLPRHQAADLNSFQSASSSSASFVRPNSSTTTGANMDEADFALNRLLELYESRPELGTAERQAICLALGSVREPAKQVTLFNLTLGQAFFRPQDSALLLESMAKLRTGRQLIWTRLAENAKQFEARQLLGPAIKAVLRSLVEAPSPLSGNKTIASIGPSDLVEQKLKQLYLTYRDGHDKLISQAIEWVRINSFWFKRDHDNLVRYLNSVSIDWREYLTPVV